LGKRYHRKAFTLIEVVLAIGLMGLVITLIASVFVSGLYSIKKGKYRLLAINIADKKITELKNLPLGDNVIDTSTISSRIYGTTGVTGNIVWDGSCKEVIIDGQENMNHIPYNYRIDVKDDPNESYLKKVTIDVNWHDPQGGDKSVKIITFVARPKKVY
jgi:hypothetical protein